MAAQSVLRRLSFDSCHKLRAGFRQLQLIHTCQDTSTVFNAEELLSKYGPKLTPKKVSIILKAQHDSAIAYKFFDWARQQRGYKHNGLAYGALIHSLCRTKGFELLEKALQKLQAEKFSITVPTFNFMLKCMCQDGKVQETLSLFRQMEDFGCKANLVTYHCVLSMLVNAGFVDQALGVYQGMRDADVSPDCLTVGMLTNALCKRGKLDEALKLADCSPSGVDSLTLNGIIGCLCKAERPHDAFRFVERMKLFGVRPGVVANNLLVYGFCKVGEVDEALELLEKMHDESLTPDVRTYIIVLDVLCKMARIDEAWQLFNRMSVEPVAATYDIMVKGLCKKRRVEDARKLVSDMTQRGFQPTIQMYVAVFHGLFKIDKANEACDLLLDLKKSGHGLDSALQNEVISGLCKGGKVDEALVLLRQIKESGFPPDKHTYAALIDGFCKAGRLLEAVDFVKSDMLKAGWLLDATALSALFNHLAEEDKFDKAMELYHTLISQGFVPDNTICSSIIKGACIAGRLDDAKRILLEMQKNTILPDKMTYEALIEGHIQHTSGAAEFFKPLIGSNVILDSDKYMTLIDGLVKGGEMEFAMDVFHEMRRVGYIPNPHTYTTLIEGMCKLNKLAQARELFQNMKEVGCEAESATFTVLLHGLCQAGQVNEADQLYREMQKGGVRPDAATYNVLLEGFSRCKSSQEVLRLLDDMRVRGCPPSDLALKLLFQNLAGRDAKKVIKYLKESFGIIYTPDSSKSKKAVQGESLSLDSSLPKATVKRGKGSSKKQMGREL